MIEIERVVVSSRCGCSLVIIRTCKPGTRRLQVAFSHCGEHTLATAVRVFLVVEGKIVF